MTLVFDTSILIDLQKGKTKTISKIKDLTKIYFGIPLITFINYFEFVFGLNLKPPKNLNESIELIEEFDVLQTTKKTAHILSKLKIKYDKLGKKIPLADLLIASIVMENKMTLVTRDNHFEVIEELDKIIL